LAHILLRSGKIDDSEGLSSAAGMKKAGRSVTYVFGG
jgi:hypothetical protein